MKVLRNRTAPRYKRAEGITSYLLASPETSGGEQLTTSWVEIRPGGKQRIHEHVPEQVYLILEGHGRMTVGSETEGVGPGDCVFIPGGAPHGLENSGSEMLRYFSAAAPKFAGQILEELWPLPSEAGESGGDRGSGMRFELPDCAVRAFEPADASSVALHANCREVWLHLRDFFPHPYTLRDAEEFIARCGKQDPVTTLAIEVEGQAAGAIGFRPGTDVERVGAEIGYWLGRQFWGRGIVPQALGAVRDHAVAEHGLTRLFALPFAWNARSFRVLEKAGFEFEGRLRRAAIKDGKVVDQLMYAYVVPREP